MIGYVGTAVKVGIALGVIDGSQDGEIVGGVDLKGNDVGNNVDLNVGAVGVREGNAVVGFRVGIIVGVRVVGWADGSQDGFVGTADGIRLLGTIEGRRDGGADGVIEGFKLGVKVGMNVGLAVGSIVGFLVGG